MVAWAGLTLTFGRGSDDDEADKVVGQAATDSVPAASTSKEGDGSGQDSSTEEEDNVAPPSKKPKHEPSSPLKPPATSSSLISEDKPLEDFGKLVVPGADLIAEAVRDMLSTIEKLVANKGGRTWPLAIQCLERVRPVAVEQEQVDQYSKLSLSDLSSMAHQPVLSLEDTFMRKLKQQCKDSGGGRLTEFWKRHMADKEERGLSELFLSASLYCLFSQAD